MKRSPVEVRDEIFSSIGIKNIDWNTVKTISIEYLKGQLGKGLNIQKNLISVEIPNKFSIKISRQNYNSEIFSDIAIIIPKNDDRFKKLYKNWNKIKEGKNNFNDAELFFYDENTDTLKITLEEEKMISFQRRGSDIFVRQISPLSKKSSTMSDAVEEWEKTNNFMEELPTSI